MGRYVNAARKVSEGNPKWTYQELCKVLDRAYVERETDIIKLQMDMQKDKTRNGSFMRKSNIFLGANYDDKS